MSIDRKIRLLSNHPLLSNASKETLRNLAEQTSFEEISSGETVIGRKESVEGLYVVAHGRFESTVPSDNDEYRVVEEFERGESFGDITLITEAPSCFTIKAVVDSLIMKLHRADFIDEILQNPSFNEMVHSQISNFMRSERKRIEPEQGAIISIGSAESRVGKSIFGINVASVLHEESDDEVCLVDFSGQPSGDLEPEIITEPGVDIDWFHESRTDQPYGYPIFSVHFPDSVSEGAVRAFLGTLTDAVLYVIVVLPSGYNSVIGKILANSDSIYFLSTDSEEAIYETDLLLDQLNDDLHEENPSPEVVLNQSTVETSAHRNKISDKLGIRVQHQLPRIEDDYVDSFQTEVPYVLKNPDHAYSQTTRRIAHEAGKRSLGLALGSGAARGLAHIGVLEVLELENIRPDRVAGSSMGALIAAAYALGHRSTRMMQHADKFSKKGGFFRFTDLSIPPNRSILRSTRIRNFLNDLFGDATFDDTEIPLSITVSDLDNADVNVITEGSIVDAVMASISIPMIFEPILLNDSTVIDGGVLDPVPVQPLENQGLDRIVAVNPIPPRRIFKEQHSERFRPHEEPSNFHPLIKSIFPFGSNNLIDVGMRTIEAIEARLAEESTKKANVVIDPYLTELSWFDFDEYNLFIEQGRRSAREKIDALESLIKPDGKTWEGAGKEKRDAKKGQV